MAAEQQANLVVRTVTLVYADLDALAPGKVSELGGNGVAGGLLQQGTQASTERTAGDVRTAKGVFDDRIVGAADFERAFAGANVEAGFAVQLGVDDQLAQKLQFSLRGMRTHGVFFQLLVIGHDGFEQITEALIALRVVLAGYLQQQALDGVEAAQRVTGDGVGQARA